MKLLIRWASIAIALFAAAYFLPGIRVSGNGWVAYAVMALILSLVNLVIRPILRFFSFPITIITLGLFLLVINAATFWLSSWLAVNYFDVRFYVDDFWSAFWGALIVSIVSSVLTGLLTSKDDE
ncbi:MAG TPA: phage holin family protein [Blastocatellia bacterium]|nr:phage holin family protein [Blastocatellia bacterium]